jgi:hypothetical protein
MEVVVCPAAMRVPFVSRRRCARAALLLPLVTLTLATGAARAGSSTAESTWDRGDAQQRALQGVPRGATVTRTACQDIGLPGNNDRYRCTVFYETTPAAPAPGGTPSGAPAGTP